MTWKEYLRAYTSYQYNLFAAHKTLPDYRDKSSVYLYEL